MESQPISEAELAEIEQRCARARNGPWTSYVEGRDHLSGSNIITVAGGVEPDDDIDIVGATIDDQDFIAHARSDVPRLIAEVRRLKALLQSGQGEGA